MQQENLPFVVRRVQVEAFAVVSCRPRFLEKRAKKHELGIHTVTNRTNSRVGIAHVHTA